MSRIKLDLSQFQHVKSDKDSTTLRHKQGHMLTVSHRPLGPEAKAQLSALSKIAQDAEQPIDKKMAEGGTVDPKPMQLDPKKAKEVSDYEKGTAKPEQNREAPARGVMDALSKLAHPMAQGGEVTNHHLVKAINDLPNNIVSAFKAAEGGKVPQADKKHHYMLPQEDYAKKVHAPENYGDMPPELPPDQQPKKTEEASIKMYADPQEPVSQDDTAPSVQPDMPIISKDLTVEPQQQPLDPEKPVIGPEIGKIGQWLMQPSGTPMADVKPADIAATKADALVDKTKQQEHSAEQVADAAHQQAAVEATPKPNFNTFDPRALAERGLQSELAGEQGKVAATTQMADEQAAQLTQDIAKKQDIQRVHDESFQKLMNERQNFIHDIQQGHIDPNKFWNDHSKVTTGIGMILAGFNPTNNPNAAVNFLEHQMNMNLEAQKANLSSNQNLLSANLAQFHNLQDATDMTRLMQADVVKTQLQQAALKATSPMAKAAALSASGAIDAKYQPLFMQLQIRDMMRNVGSGGAGAQGSTGAMLNGLDMVSPEQAKTYRERYYAPYDVPGGKSIADRPIPNDVRGELAAHDKFDAAAKNLKALLEKNHGKLSTMHPIDSQAAMQQAMILQSLFRENTLRTVYREGEQPLLDKAINGNPMSLVHYFTAIPKLDGLVQSNNTMKNTVLNSYGLRPPKSTQAPQQQPVMGKDGKMYTRQGNYMVPVK